MLGSVEFVGLQRRFRLERGSRYIVYNLRLVSRDSSAQQGSRADQTVCLIVLWRYGGRNVVCGQLEVVPGAVCLISPYGRAKLGECIIRHVLRAASFPLITFGKVLLVAAVER